MSNGTELVKYIKEHPEWRSELIESLYASNDTVCTYYLCSLSALPSILGSGIKCHDHAHSSQIAVVDLSSHDVQVRRQSVHLCKWSEGHVLRKFDVPAHSCINLFWNPINTTFEAFQRNALIVNARSGAVDDTVVCILEVNAERILTEDIIWWCSTNGNIASRSYNQCELYWLANETYYNWAATFETKISDQDGNRASKVAEFIAYHEGPGEISGPLPSYLLRRVICPFKHVSHCEEILDQSGLDISAAGADVFKDTAALLKAEVQLIVSLDLKRNDRLNACFARAFKDLLAFEELSGPLTPDDFSITTMTYSQHGIRHIVRVMFWIAVLGRLVGIADDELVAAMTSARFHDLCKSHDMKDPHHGARAAEQKANAIRHIIKDDLLADRAISAVRLHDLPDHDGDLDPILRILKDADALDRGRFGSPDADYGCNTSLLRSPVVHRSNDPYRNIAWAAFWLAMMTKQQPNWHNQPCKDFSCQVGFGLRAAIQAELYSENTLVLAKQVSSAALDAIT